MGFDKRNLMFKDLPLDDAIVDALASQGFTEPFEIQADVIPVAVAGTDVLAKAPTGSGKTLGFGIPMIQLSNKAKPHKPTGLILSPTRELAEQIKKDLQAVAGEVDVTVTAVYGGAGIGRQISRLERGVDILVACPGRLLDLIEQRKLDLGSVETVTIDEADQLCDMGFLPDIKRIMKQVSNDAQVLLFSATLDNDVSQITKAFQDNPVEFDITTEEIDLTHQEHHWILAPVDKRASMLAEMLQDNERTIVFSRTKRGAERLARQLTNHGLPASSIHGDKSQRQRHTALEQFKNDDVFILVATDVAARGIHVDNVARVVNFDVAADHKDYVHRSGRTARAGNSGKIVNLVRPEDKKKAKFICKDLGIEFDLDTETASTHETVALPVPKPKKPSRGGSGRGGQGRGGAGGRGRGGSGSGGQGDRRPRRGDSDDESKPRSRRKPPRSKSRSSDDSEKSNDWRPSKSKPGAKRNGKPGSKNRSKPGARSEDGSASRGGKPKKKQQRREADSNSRSKAKPGKAGRSGKPRPKSKSGGKSQGSAKRS